LRFPAITLKMNKTKYFGLLLLLLPFLVDAQPPQRTSNAEYIQKFKDDAIREMHRMGVPASITLAQGILESDAGNSDLAREANNHFGIKCHKEWTGETFIKDDDEKNECFRKYNNVLESFDDHGRFLRERPRYASLFDIKIDDYESWAVGLKKAGYATNPRYAELLIKIIVENNLAQYDKGGKNIPVVPGEASPAPITQQPSKPTPAPSNSTTKHTTPSKSNANNVPFVYSKSGDTWYSIAVANDMRLWQILKYNDAQSGDLINEGEIVYLKPKRGNPTEQFHTVVAGETLRGISQKYGVKLKRLVKLNKMGDSISVQPGQKIKLK
jgi:LysM repeat protein